jgi:hypothetical protein
MTKDLKDLIDNIYQLATNSRDTSAVIRMVGTVHAVDEALLVLTKQRDDARWWAKEAIDEIIKERDEARREICVLQVLYSRFYHVGEESECAKDRGWDCYKETL